MRSVFYVVFQQSSRSFPRLLRSVRDERRLNNKQLEIFAFVARINIIVFFVAAAAQVPCSLPMRARFDSQLHGLLSRSLFARLNARCAGMAAHGFQWCPVRHLPEVQNESEQTFQLVNSSRKQGHCGQPAVTINALRVIVQ